MTTGQTVGQALSAVSGIPEAEVSDIFNQVKANHAALRSCTGHVFKDITPAKETIRKKYHCTKCHGEIDGMAHFWYQQGLLHAMAGL